MLESKRLILRPWMITDGDTLYDLAKDPEVGYPCGWQPHTMPMESQIILEDVLMNDETYAIVLKETNVVIGNIALFKKSQYVQKENEKELGFWLGKKYWNLGYATEASLLMIDYGFNKLNLDKIWIAHFIDNIKSKRVQEKCNFKYSHTHRYYSDGLEKDVTTIVNVITKEEYIKK